MKLIHVLEVLQIINCKHNKINKIWNLFQFLQAIFFSVETHPNFEFRQCVTSSFLSSPEDVRMYSIFSVSAMYFAPLLVIIFTYTAILLKIIRKSRQQQNTTLSHSTTTTLSTPPSGTRFSIKSRLRRANSASASSAHTTTMKPLTTPLPAMNLNNSNSDPNCMEDSTGTFTPSPSTKASTRRFNFSRGSIGKVATCINLITVNVQKNPHEIREQHVLSLDLYMVVGN